MSGRRIDDHSFWAGKSTEKSTLPEGVKTKDIADPVGAGSIANYPDMEESIKRTQEENVRQARKHAQPSDHRN